MIYRQRLTIGTDQRGVALIEFVMVFPLLMMLLFGCLEFSRYLMIHLKVQNATYALANIVTQYPASSPTLEAGKISYTELMNTLGGNQLAKMLSPFGSDPTRQGMIITSIRRENAKHSTRPVIKWQIFTGGSISAVESAVNQKTPATISNVAGFVRDLPTSFDATKNPGASTASLAGMFERENMIVVEVFYRYDPLYTQIFSAIGLSFSAFNFPGLSPQIITRQTFMRPRSGDLICLPGAPGDVFIYPSAECS